MLSREVPRKILEALASGGQAGLIKSEIAERAYPGHGTKQLALISRETKKLREAGLVSEVAEGKTRRVRLTPRGRKETFPDPFAHLRNLLAHGAPGNETEHIRKEAEFDTDRPFLTLRSAAIFAAASILEKPALADEHFAQALALLIDARGSILENARTDRQSLEKLVGDWPSTDARRRRLMELALRAENPAERIFMAASLAKLGEEVAKEGASHERILWAAIAVPIIQRLRFASTRMASEVAQRLLPVCASFAGADQPGTFATAVALELRARMSNATGNMDKEMASWKSLARVEADARAGRKRPTAKAGKGVDAALEAEVSYQTKKGAFNALVLEVEHRYVRGIVGAARTSAPSHTAALLRDGSAAALDDFLMWIEDDPEHAKHVVDQCVDDFRDNAEHALDKLANHEDMFGSIAAKLRGQASFILRRDLSSTRRLPTLSAHDYREYIFNNGWSPAMVAVDVASSVAARQVVFPTSAKAQISSRRPAPRALHARERPQSEG